MQWEGIFTAICLFIPGYQLSQLQHNSFSPAHLWKSPKNNHLNLNNAVPWLSGARCSHHISQLPDQGKQCPLSQARDAELRNCSAYKLSQNTAGKAERGDCSQDGLNTCRRTLLKVSMSKRDFLEWMTCFCYTERSLKTYQQHLRLSNLKADNPNSIQICWGIYLKCDPAVKYTTVFYSQSITNIPYIKLIFLQNIVYSIRDSCNIRKGRFMLLIIM